MTPREIYFERIHGIHKRAIAVEQRLGIRDVYHYYTREMERLSIPREESTWNYIEWISKETGHET